MSDGCVEGLLQGRLLQRRLLQMQKREPRLEPPPSPPPSATESVPIPQTAEHTPFRLPCRAGRDTPLSPGGSSPPSPFPSASPADAEPPPLVFRWRSVAQSHSSMSGQSLLRHSAVPADTNRAHGKRKGNSETSEWTGLLLCALSAAQCGGKRNGASVKI